MRQILSRSHVTCLGLAVASASLLRSADYTPNHFVVRIIHHEVWPGDDWVSLNSLIQKARSVEIEFLGVRTTTAVPMLTPVLPYRARAPPVHHTGATRGHYLHRGV